MTRPEEDWAYSITNHVRSFTIEWTRSTNRNRSRISAGKILQRILTLGWREMLRGHLRQPQGELTYNANQFGNPSLKVSRELLSSATQLSAIRRHRAGDTRPRGARGSVNWNESVRMKILCSEELGDFIPRVLCLCFPSCSMDTREWEQNPARVAFETAFHLQGLRSRFSSRNSIRTRIQF